MSTLSQHELFHEIAVVLPEYSCRECVTFRPSSRFVPTEAAEASRTVPLLAEAEYARFHSWDVQPLGRPARATRSMTNGQHRLRQQ